MSCEDMLLRNLELLLMIIQRGQLEERILNFERIEKL